MSYAVDIEEYWMLDFQQLPGCRLNASTLRFFARHADMPWYFIGRPTTVNRLVLTRTEVDLPDVTDGVPAPNKADTAMAFVTRKL
ncbi:MAG: hypothetical protein IPM06_16990 [Rhizobiales bacterium]|nr:hypothetical protein [Hyphomicrobiales bacterium]